MNIEEISKKLEALLPKDKVNKILETELLAIFPEYVLWEEKADKNIPETKLFEIFPEELEQGRIVLENFLGRWGNISTEALTKICLILQHIKPSTIFEMGTYNGMTTLQMACNSPKNCKIFTIDLPPDTKTKNKISEMDEIVYKHFDGKLGTHTGSYFENHPMKSKITQLLGDTGTFDFTPYYNQMDIVFIDAAHDYDNKKSDTENALQMIKPNGIIIWDNYKDPLNPYVTKYLSELNLPLHWLKNTNLVVFRG